jgi:hypothetical protein
MRWANPEDIYEFTVSRVIQTGETYGCGRLRRPWKRSRAGRRDESDWHQGPKEGVQVKVISGVSFLDLALAEINFDFALGYKFYCPWRIFSAACSQNTWR